MNNNITSISFENFLNSQIDKNAIREVYLGNIGNYNQNERILASEDYQKELAKANEIKSQLVEQLNEEQILELEKILELHNIYGIEVDVASYEYGFKLGVNLGMESGKFTKQTK